MNKHVYYQINNAMGYMNETDTINLHMPSNMTSELTDDEAQEWIVNAIVHEHIHRAIQKLFGYVMSALFDAVGHHFTNQKLYEKALRRHMNENTWKEAIDSRGIKALFNYYALTRHELLEAGIKLI